MSVDKESSGVEELIQRLREQGVAAGKSQADELLEQTRRLAEQRLEAARREAEEIVQLAREDAKQTKQAGEEAVQLAVRDSILRLKSELVERFADRVRRLVTRELEDYTLSLHDALPISEERRVGKECKIGRASCRERV